MAKVAKQFAEGRWQGIGSGVGVGTRSVIRPLQPTVGLQANEMIDWKWKETLGL